MGALLSREIIQSRIWLNPKGEEVPIWNYKEIFPITVFDAVRESMDDDKSTTLTEILQDIYKQIAGKQPIFPNKPANYLMTFAGVQGGVGSIEIGTEIPYDPAKRTHSRIPTEKAVGDFLLTIGLVIIDDNGNLVLPDPDTRKVTWSEILGRPQLYNGLGNNTDGFIIQSAMTDIINGIVNDLTNFMASDDSRFNTLKTQFDTHVADNNNPHNMTVDSIGAASKIEFDTHATDYNNPHNTNKFNIGLGNVDNTSDRDKPISNSTQSALDNIIQLLTDSIGDIDSTIDGMNYISDITYDQPTGKLKITFINGTIVFINIPIDNLVEHVAYDSTTKELKLHKLGGHVATVDIRELFINGSIGNEIALTFIKDTNDTRIIKASIIDNSIVASRSIKHASITTALYADQSVSAAKIKNRAVTNDKLDEESVTSNKLDINSVTTTKISNRAVTGDKIFSSTVDNRVLAVTNNGSSPMWLQIVSQMIANNGIETVNVKNEAITEDKLGISSVTTDKLADGTITNIKIKDNTIANDKLLNSTITGLKIAPSITLPGTPKIQLVPSINDSSTSIASTQWVKNNMDIIQIRNDNLVSRSVDGRVLFTSTAPYKVLAVIAGQTDPVWTSVTGDMIDEGTIESAHIQDNSIGNKKIANNAILSNHISYKAIQSNHIDDDAIENYHIFKSQNSNMVLGVTLANTNPNYVKINKEMMGYNSVGMEQILPQSITMDKIIQSEDPHMILGSPLKNSPPKWTKATNQMLDNRIVDGRVLFTSPIPHRVLTVSQSYENPEWTRIIGEMIKENEITSNHLKERSITGDSLADSAIESRSIAANAIKEINIDSRAVTGAKLFTSDMPNRVLGVGTYPYTNAEWLQVNTEMIEDGAVTGAKLFTSNYPYRVIASTQAGTPPEYIKLTNDFIMDDTIRPQKLVRDFVFFGSPTIALRPDSTANDSRIPDTRWVRETIANIIKDFNPEILFESIDTDMITNHSITGRKLMTHPYAPRVLGITHPNADVEFLLIEEALIADGSVTNNKLRRDITLMGSPSVEVRPSSVASDAQGGGALIPDCQWVLDRINEGSIGGGGGGGGTPVLTPGIVGTNFLANRAVTGEKLFTTATANRVLGVLGSNTSPQYLKVINDMIDDKAITGRTLFTTTASNMVLGVTTANSTPIYTKINNQMLGDNIISTDKIQTYAVTKDKILDGDITIQKLADEPMINTTRLIDKSVTGDKIASNAIIPDTMIPDNTISSEKLRNDVILRGYPTVDNGTDLTKRSVRNTIISPDSPSGGQHGDIWFRYI
jgi:hypothetical protein